MADVTPGKGTPGEERTTAPGRDPVTGAGPVGDVTGHETAAAGIGLPAEDRSGLHGAAAEDRAADAGRETEHGRNGVPAPVVGRETEHGRNGVPAPVVGRETEAGGEGAHGAVSAGGAAGTAAGTSGAVADGGATSSPLLARDECDAFGGRLRHAVTGFVDAPRDAVEEADRVVEELADRLAEALTRRRRTLRAAWQAADSGKSATTPDTEQLRLALRDYRELADRLLHI